MLTGFTHWFVYSGVVCSIPQTLGSLQGLERFQEAIVLMPDGFCVFLGGVSRAENEGIFPALGLLRELMETPNPWSGVMNQMGGSPNSELVFPFPPFLVVLSSEPKGKAVEPCWGHPEKTSLPALRRGT